MDKNTIWAIVLSTLVIIGAYLVYPLIISKKAPVVAEQTTEQVEENKETVSSEEVVKIENSEELVVESENNEEVVVETTVEKQVIPPYESEKILVEFSQEGGDIVSFKFKEKNDKVTKEFIELADNVNINNRACSISLGTSDSTIINDLFKFEKDESNPNVYTFVKTNLNNNGKKIDIKKVYTFNPNEFMFKLDVMIHSEDGLDMNGAAYTIRTAPQVGPYYDQDNKYENRQFISYDGKKSKKIVIVPGQFKRYNKRSIWAGIVGTHCENIIIPVNPENINAAFYSSKDEIGNSEKDYNKTHAQALYERKSFTNTNVTDTYYMYYGPRRDKDIKIYNNSDTNFFGLSGLKLVESLPTSGWLGWLEITLTWCIEMLHKIIPNWGVCIIVLTILIKLLMFPISKNQSMGTLKMQELQPKIQSIQEKYKDDKQKQQMEMQKIYQEAHYNPASGCLPMVFQFLILLAMYNMLRYYFEFYDAEFIKGWIPYLSDGDSIYKIKGWAIPIIGNQIRILPIVYVISQIFFSLITQNGGTSAGQSGLNMKLMTYGMPILFFFLFYSAPSGLLIYWITSNLIQLVQQLVINAMMKKKRAEMKSKALDKKTGKITKK